jgi:hypothetical protein
LLSFPGDFRFVVTSATLEPFSMWKRELAKLELPFVYHSISSHFIDTKKQFMSTYLNICPKYSREDCHGKKLNKKASKSANKLPYYSFSHEVRK